MAIARIIRENEMLRKQNEDLRRKLDKKNVIIPMLVLATIAAIVMLPVVLGLN